MGEWRDPTTIQRRRRQREQGAPVVAAEERIGAADRRLPSLRYEQKPDDLCALPLARRPADGAQPIVPSLADFAALAVVRHQARIASLDGVPWDPCGRLISKHLRDRRVVPAASLVCAMLQAYPHLRDSNSVLILRGQLVQRPVLMRLASLAARPATQHLVYLSVSRSDLTDSAVWHLSHLSHLRVLDVSHTAVGDDGVVGLMRHAEYRRVSADLSSSSSSSSSSSPHLSSLRYLNLAHTNVSNASVPHLTRNPTLVGLDVTGTHVTSLGAASGAGLAAECRTWIRLPDGVRLFAFQRKTDVPTVEPPITSSDLQLVTGAWLDPALAHDTERNEIWHYAMGVPLGRRLPPLDPGVDAAVVLSRTRFDRKCFIRRDRDDDSRPAAAASPAKRVCRRRDVRRNRCPDDNDAAALQSLPGALALSSAATEPSGSPSRQDSQPTIARVTLGRAMPKGIMQLALQAKTKMAMRSATHKS